VCGRLSWEQAPRPGSRKRPPSPSVRSRAPLAPGALALEVLTRCGGLRLALVACTLARACALASVTPDLGLAASVRRWASTSRLRLQAEPRPCGLGLTGAVTIASRGFTGQGPTGVHRRHLSLSRELYPNPIRSDTSCREIDASPAGDSDVAGDALPETQRGIRLSRSRHTPRTPAKGRARVPPMTCLREAAGPESHKDHSGADDANATRGQGPHHPFFREEERDQPHPRCLPSMSRLVSSRSAEASPLMARGSPARAIHDRGLELSTGCHQLWTTPAPLAIPPDPLPLTGPRGRGTGDVYR